MNAARLRSKRVVLSTVAAVATLGIGGAVWTSAASADLPVDERDRVAEAATEAVPGTVVDVENSDDAGEPYEVEIRQDDGTEVEVALDQDLVVVSEQTGTDDANDSAPDADDRVLTDAERTSAEAAALAAVDGGTVADVEAGDDPGVAYEVDVRDAKHAEWDVELDADFTVLSTTADD